MPLYHKGFALAKLGRNEDAVMEYNRALAQDPGNAQTHFQKGVLLAKLGRYEEAVYLV